MKIFDGRNLSEYEDEAREQPADLYGAENIDDYDVFNKAARWAADDLDSELDNIAAHFDRIGGGVLAIGTCGTWRGAMAGGNVYDDFKSAYYAIFGGCDYITIDDERGRLIISGSHHDGHNSAESLTLTERGANLLDKWAYDYNDERTEQEVHEIAASSNLFTKRPYFARDYYGAKEFRKAAI